MMLDRTSRWLLGAGLLVSCTAGYPDARPSSSSRAAAAPAVETASPARTAAPVAATTSAGEPAGAGEAAPESWAESLDEFVFGAGRPEAKAPRAGGPEGSEGVSGARRALELQKAGSLALDEGRVEEAFASFQAAYDVAPASSRWKYLLVMANIRTGMRRDEEALDLYRRLLEIRPPQPRIDDLLYGNVALLYFRLDRLAEAREAVARALEVNPEFPEGLRTLGLIEIAAGRVARGIELLERAVALKPGIPEAQVALAEHEEAIGRREKAAARYRYLLEIMESDEFRDPLGRWRYLFDAAEPRTEDEFRARIERLESSGETTENTRG